MPSLPETEECALSPVLKGRIDVLVTMRYVWESVAWPLLSDWKNLKEIHGV